MPLEVIVRNISNIGDLRWRFGFVPGIARDLFGLSSRFVRGLFESVRGNPEQIPKKPRTNLEQNPIHGEINPVAHTKKEASGNFKMPIRRSVFLKKLGK